MVEKVGIYPTGEGPVRFASLSSNPAIRGAAIKWTHLIGYLT
jgi:hypothetical protein